jgi:endoglucanase
VNTETLLTLLSSPSPTGFEIRGQNSWMTEAARVSDEVDVDAYGNSWATLRGTEGGPRVMICAHCDEIGFTVRHISEKGFLAIGPIGGSDVTIARGRRIKILGDAGDVTGIIGNTAIHLRKRADDKSPGWEDLFVDIGCSTREEVAKRGVRVGQAAVYEDLPFEFAPGLICGRAIDNRVGGWILLETLTRLHALPDRHATVLALNTVQEEIGGNGARMAGFRLKPDFAIVLDVTHATDTPGIDQNQHGDVRLGKGPALTHGTANHPGIVRRLMEVADQEGIDVQHEASNARGTSTDTDDIFWLHSGIPCALVSTPLRYMHSPVEILATVDAEKTTQLLVSFIRGITDGTAFNRPG